MIDVVFSLMKPYAIHMLIDDEKFMGKIMVF